MIDKGSAMMTKALNAVSKSPTAIGTTLGTGFGAVAGMGNYMFGNGDSLMGSVAGGMAGGAMMGAGLGKTAQIGKTAQRMAGTKGGKGLMKSAEGMGQLGARAMGFGGKGANRMTQAGNIAGVTAGVGGAGMIAADALNPWGLGFGD